MSVALMDVSAPALVAAIWANPLEWLRYLGSSPKAEFHDSPQLTWLLTDIPSPTVNTILRTQAEPGNVDASIEKALAHFRSRDVTRFSWWIGPGTQ